MLEKFLNAKNNTEFLCKTILGLERETIRTTLDGKLSLTPHPMSLGNPLNHPLIKTDFCESQLEYSTRPSYRMSYVFKTLENLHSFTVRNLPQNEFLWPFSMPPELPEDEGEIPLAYYGNTWEGVTKTVYRRGLGFRYGRRMQTISGVHINISFSKYFMNWASRERYGEPLHYKTQSNLYLDAIRNFNRYSFLLIYLFGASPALDQSFAKEHKEFIPWKRRTRIGEYATSIRLSELGYTSSVQNQLYISFNNLEEYVRDLRRYTSLTYPPYSQFNHFQSQNPSLKEFQNWNQLNDYYLQIENEYYTLIRPKQIPEGKKRLLDALAEKGIRYLEVRCMDNDPFFPTGVSQEAVSFVEIFLLFCLLQDSPPMSENEKTVWDRNQQSVVWKGRDPSTFYEVLGEKKTIHDWFYQIYPELEKVADFWDTRVQCVGQGSRNYREALRLQKEKILNSELLPSQKILNELKIKNQEFLEYGMELGQEYKNRWLSNPLDKRILQTLETYAKESWDG